MTQNRKEYHRTWRQAHPGYHSAYCRDRRKARPGYYTDLGREWRRNARLQLIKDFGGQCVECGNNDPVVLDFDHIRNDGAKHRQGKPLSLKMIKTAPEKFQLLCKNCNWKKEYWRRRDAKQNTSASPAYGRSSTWMA